MKKNWYEILGLRYYSLECRYLKAPSDAEVHPHVLYLYLEGGKLTYKARANAGGIVIAEIKITDLPQHHDAIKALLQSPDQKKLTTEQTTAVQALADLRGLRRTTHEVTEQHIKGAYRKLALETHPDKGGDAAKFRLINDAYTTLIDADERRRFDEEWTDSPDALDETFAGQGVSAFQPLTTNARPYSELFRDQHAQFVRKYQQQPLTRGSNLPYLEPLHVNGYVVEKSDGSQLEFGDLFLFLKEQAKYSLPPSQTDPLLSQPLSLAHAVDLLINFVEGYYYGEALIKLKTYFQEQIRQCKTGDMYKPELLFYEGIDALIGIALGEPVSAATLIAALQKITDYAKADPEKTMSVMAPLLQNKYFRQLAANSLHHYWQTPLLRLDQRAFKALDAQETAKTILMNLNRSRKQTTNADLPSLDATIRYMRLLYLFEKDVYEKIDTGTTALFYRDKAYHILDWLPAFSGKASEDILTNIFLMAGWCFQLAATKETSPTMQMADEQSALGLYLLALHRAEHEQPTTVLYVLVHIIKLITQFIFQEPSLKEKLPQLQRWALQIAKLFPFYVPLQSSITHLLQTQNYLALMRQLLQALHKIMESNRTRPPPEQTLLDHRYARVLYAIYEACLKQWYEETYNPQTEQTVKLALMQQLLADKRWKFLDVNRNLQSPWIAIERDAQQWMRPLPQLPIPVHPGLDVFRSVEGLTIDYKTGEICFVFKPWQANDPPYSKVLTLFDLQELLEKNIQGGFFSLEPVKPSMPYHPFNEMLFTSKLYETQLLHSMLLTDYLLKFFTVGQEVQPYPYGVRPLDTLLQSLPPYLRRIIDEFHQAQHKASLHRFWIAAQKLPLTSTIFNTGGIKQEHIALGELKMVVKKHEMRHNLKGELEDCLQEDEGWFFYILTPAQKQAVEQGRQKIQAPSLIIIEGQTSLYCYEDNAFSAVFNCPEFREKFFLLNKEKRDATGKVEINNDNQLWLYRLIRNITAKIRKPHYFTPEHVFAQEFTDHYDEFAQYFPEFGRLAQLIRLTSVISILNNMREANQEKMEGLEKALNDAPHWQQRQQTIHNAISNCQQQYNTHYQSALQQQINGIQTQFAKWGKSLNRATLLKEEQERLKKINEQFGTLTYGEHSPEVDTACQHCYDDNFRRIESEYGWTVAHDKSSEIWGKVNAGRARLAHEFTTSKRESVETQLRNGFAVLGKSVSSTAFTSIITQWMNGNTMPLADALVTRELAQEKESIRKSLPGSTIVDIEKMLQGHIPTITHFATGIVDNDFASDKRQMEAEVAHLQTIVETEKNQLRTPLQACKNLEAQCVRLGMGKHAQPPDLRKICLWIPANVRHNTHGHSARLVYGGVEANPVWQPIKSDTLEGQLLHQTALNNPKHEGITVDYYVQRTQTEIPENIRQDLGSRTFMYAYRMATEAQKTEAKARAAGEDVAALYREVAAEQARKKQAASSAAGGGKGRSPSPSSSDSSSDEEFSPPKQEKHKLAEQKRMPWKNANEHYLTQKALDEGWSPPYTAGVNVTDVTTAEEIRFVRVHEKSNPAKKGKRTGDDDSVGSFLVREKEIRHIINDPKALQAYLALRSEPTFIVEVHVPKGTHLRVGLIGAQPNFGVSSPQGRFQYELLDRIPIHHFKDSKPILKKSSLQYQTTPQ